MLGGSQVGNVYAGRVPWTFKVEQGAAVLDEFKEHLDAGRCPTGRRYAQQCQRFSEMNGLSVYDFFVSLFNLSQHAHGEVHVAMMKQALLASCIKTPLA
eukprot:3528810-Pyramimonas_sp.AAC.1